jgi:phenylacetate-CoA ligase
MPNIINPYLGRSYSKSKSVIKNYEGWNIQQRQQFVFNCIRQNTEYAYANIPFYHDYYDENNFNPSELKTFIDIRRIPSISKSTLLEYPVDIRSCQTKGAIKVNTGGSSGHTLDFYKDKDIMENHVNAHMTTIWMKLNYQNSELKLVLSGANTVKDGIDFCFRSNSIRLDTYKEFDQSAGKLKKIAKKSPIRFLHGYPSIIYEFALYCDEYDHDLREILRKSLKGAFLGSEYPHTVFRDKIEQIFDIETVNWYGHTEGAVLAWEKNEKYRYYPFQTYGFAEMTDEGYLMASTYYDKASPFIRYNTEDKISDAEIKDGFLISFGIEKGRSGEFITDRNGKKISLTALIFGRHHRLFNTCSHIQICQREIGKADVLYILKEGCIDFMPELLFDGSNIEMQFSFKRLNNPIKTKSGKLNLLVKPEELGE